MDTYYWFNKKQQKFVKNIDTFYYSVYLCNDFSSDTQDTAVFYFGHWVEENCINPENIIEFEGDYPVILSIGGYAIYHYRFSSPDFFDIFFNTTLNQLNTPHFIIQLRSRCLWEDGVYKSFDDSFSFIQFICEQFGFEVKEIKENRCDFCCHSNYLSEPEKFFDRDNFVKMWVGSVGRTKEKTKHYSNHITVYDNNETETDYISIGKRGSKCFIRIYLKSKEVIQEGYKSFFFPIWLEYGLISQYDLFCYELAYKEKKWCYIDIARLKWALKYDDTLSDVNRAFISDVISQEKPDYPLIRKVAKTFTKPVTKIFNVEFQVMRDMSKSFCLVKKNQGITAHIYDYLDNFSLIYDYLTSVSFRLVRPDTLDSNKSRNENCAFWDRLRSSKCHNFKQKNKNVSLIRKYSSNINAELKRIRALRAVASFGLSYTLNPDFDIYEDCQYLINTLNDNDIKYIDDYRKKLYAKNKEILPDKIEKNA